MIDALKVINYALAIKGELGFKDIEKAKETVDELLKFATENK